MNALRALLDSILAALLRLAGFGRRWGTRRGEVDPRERRVGTVPGADRLVAALLGAGSAGALAFAVLYVVDPNTQLLGATLGGALCALAAAAAVAAKRILPRETEEEERPRLVHPEEIQESERHLKDAAEGISRRRLLTGAAGAAGASLAAAAAVPIASLGPRVDDRIDRTPWRRGRGVVDEQGRPILADDVTEGTFLTGFPEGADQRELGSPIVLVRVDPAALRLPRGRGRWAPEGILAYSKICTHAGCAIALYRKPLYPPTSPRPALVCPCHYSTFDPARGAEVIFGPAGRPLPQLPLAIDAQRRLVAGGGFSGSIGPAWWSVRR